MENRFLALANYPGFVSFMIKKNIMKKMIVFFTIVLLSFNVKAQPGVKLGANFASITGDDSEDMSMRVAFYAGVYYNVMINEMFSFQPELVYSSQGAKFDNSDNARLVLNYLNLTALFRYNTSSGVFVGTGPQFGLLTSAKVKDDNASVDFKDFLKSSDFAWAFALGYVFSSGFGVYGRYNLGLANILEDGDWKNSVIQLGVRFDIKNAKQ